MNYNSILYRLSKSKFRSKFYLNDDMKKYVRDKGMKVINGHANDFINERLRPSNPYHDGKQTPMRGHPVFIAQHACGCCCRGCLEKWHKIPKGRELTDDEVEYIVGLIMQWISINS